MNKPSQRARDAGFSLIELIVVVGMIGILSAIAVPSYIGVQDSVRNSSTQSDLGSNRIALVAYAIDNNGIVPASAAFDPRTGGSNLFGYGWSQSIDTTSYRYVTNTARTTWCLDMTSSTGAVFRISTSNTGWAPGPCSGLALASY